jgi:polyisoprenoid-binding protein YceI
MRYLLDASQSRFTVQAFARGALAALGHSPTFAVRAFTGEMRFADESMSDAAIQMTVQADSLALVDSVSANDREEIERKMRQEVLETSAYPQIGFQSTDIRATKIADGRLRLAIAGKLSLHGMTKSHQLEAQLRVMETGISLSGDCALSQPVYGIKPVSALGGLIRLKDELKIAFELVGRNHRD